MENLPKWLFHDTEKLRKLITDNPDLPLVVCKLTRMPVSDTRGGCHKYDERINYMQ